MLYFVTAVDANKTVKYFYESDSDGSLIPVDRPNEATPIRINEVANIEYYIHEVKAAYPAFTDIGLVVKDTVTLDESGICTIAKKKWGFEVKELEVLYKAVDKETNLIMYYAGDDSDGKILMSHFIKDAKPVTVCKFIDIYDMLDTLRNQYPEYTEFGFSLWYYSEPYLQKVDNKQKRIKELTVEFSHEVVKLENLSTSYCIGDNDELTLSDEILQIAERVRKIRSELQKVLGEDNVAQS